MDPLTRKLIQLLQSPDLELRSAALRVIGELEVNGQPVIQAVGRCLREPREEHQILALKVLNRLGAGEAVNVIVPLLASSGVLSEHALAIVIAVGQKAVPALTQLFDESAEVSLLGSGSSAHAVASAHFARRAVVTALAAIGGKVALQFLVERLSGSSGELQRHLISSVCDALDRTPPAQQSVVFDSVADLLGSEHDQTKIGAINILGHFKDGSTAGKARAALRRFAERKYPLEVRRYALLSYQRLLEGASPTADDLKFLKETLCDGDWQNISRHALAALEKMAVSPKEFAFFHELLRRSPHLPVRRHVLGVMGNVDRAEIAESILPFLGSEDLALQERAEQTLRSMPSAAPRLLALVAESDDFDVAQRSYAILRELPPDVRARQVERAVDLLVECLDQNVDRHKFFLEFVRSVDPEPLRKRLYRLAKTLKTGRTRDRWERIVQYLRLLWDHHLITPEGRYLLAVALLKQSDRDLAPATRRENLGLQVIRALIYDDQEHLVRTLKRDRDLGPEDIFYLGFHFAEEGEATRPFGAEMLEHVLRTAPASNSSRSAAQFKLNAMRAADSAAAEVKAARQQKKKRRPDAAVRHAAGAASAASSASSTAASSALAAAAAREASSPTPLTASEGGEGAKSPPGAKPASARKSAAGAAKAASKTAPKSVSPGAASATSTPSRSAPSPSKTAGRPVAGEAQKKPSAAAQNERKGGGSPIAPPAKAPSGRVSGDKSSATKPSAAKPPLAKPSVSKEPAGKVSGSKAPISKSAMGKVPAGKKPVAAAQRAKPAPKSAPSRASKAEATAKRGAAKSERSKSPASKTPASKSPAPKPPASKTKTLARRESGEEKATDSRGSATKPRPKKRR
jgi:hypothetical protein